MGKTRDLFQKIRHTKRTFHAKMGSIKDKNGTVPSAHDSALRPALRYKPAANTAWRHWERRGMNSEMS